MNRTASAGPNASTSASKPFTRSCSVVSFLLFTSRTCVQDPVGWIRDDHAKKRCVPLRAPEQRIVGRKKDISCQTLGASDVQGVHAAEAGPLELLGPLKLDARAGEHLRAIARERLDA